MDASESERKYSRNVYVMAYLFIRFLYFCVSSSELAYLFVPFNFIRISRAVTAWTVFVMVHSCQCNPTVYTFMIEDDRGWEEGGEWRGERWGVKGEGD